MDNQNNPLLNLANGQPKQNEFEELYLLQTIHCANCGNSFAIQSITKFDDKQTMFDASVKSHNDGIQQAKILCANPKLMVVYLNALQSK